MANLAFIFKQGTFISVLPVHCVETKTLIKIPALFFQITAKANNRRHSVNQVTFAMILVIFRRMAGFCEYHKNIYSVLGK